MINAGNVTLYVCVSHNDVILKFSQPVDMFQVDISGAENILKQLEYAIKELRSKPIDVLPLDHLLFNEMRNEESIVENNIEDEDPIYKSLTNDIDTIDRLFGCGSCLHIVIDDYNLDDNHIEFCKNYHNKVDCNCVKNSYDGKLDKEGASAVDRVIKILETLTLEERKRYFECL